MMGMYGAQVWGRGGFGMPWMAIGGIVLALALLALAITAIVVLVRWSRKARGGESMEILRARFARGEIAREQYEETRRTLAS